MSLIELNNVSRFYPVGKDQKKYALDHVSLSFPTHGLICILGKSGCGKSTLLNLIGKIDKPSEGKIFFNNKDITKYSEKKTISFRRQVISYIFQHYHLLENQSTLFNVMLPALISGCSYRVAKQKAIDLLNSFSINKELFDKRCADLSGGEKERVAILRAFINEPKVILADEPTGALDKDNATLTMEALRKISETSLVIVVTHNESLAKEYGDRIIRMSDGRVVKDERINNLFNSEVDDLKHNKNSHNWFNKIVLANIKKRFKRNLFSISALVIGLVATMLIVGFVNGKDDAIVKSMENQFDYGAISVSKERRIISPDSPIALIQSMRPSYDEMTEIMMTCSDFHVCYSYDALISVAPTISINEEEITNFSYNPIHSFTDDSIDTDLLAKGRIPTFDTLNQVVINQNAYRALNKKLKFDCLNSYIRISEQQSYSFPTGNADTPYVTDYFVYDRLVQIVGVINEISFLNSPKIFYPYVAMDKYMEETVLNNLSIYLGETTWKDKVIDSLDNEQLSAFSCRLFLKDHQNLLSIKKLGKELGEKFSVTCNGLTVEETLFSLVNAASIGMEVFLAIALVGMVLILGIVSFASYNEDIKDSAILLCYGAKRDDIALIYILESLFIGLVSVAISFILATLLTKPVNALIAQLTGLKEIINIPFLSFHNRFLLLPLVIIISTMLVCLLATYLPIGFSKKISLKEELKEND